jgi:hypothetical protein
MTQPRRALLPVMLAAALVAGCQERKLVTERGGGVQVGMPAAHGRMVSLEPADGIIEHAEAKKRWRTKLSWDPDPRSGAVSDEEALQAAGLEHASLVKSARSFRALTKKSDNPESNEEQSSDLIAVDGHPAAMIHAPGGDALVWRCERSGRIFVYLREGDPKFSLDELAKAVRCHELRSKPENAQVPGVNLIALGEGWGLSKRTASSTVYLRGDALLELFAGQKIEPSDDLIVAAHLAPAWVEAGGLRGVKVVSGEHVNGPQGHPAVSLRGEATLDGRAVRWSFLEWRCLERARTYGALVVSEQTQSDAAKAGARASGGFTGHDQALLAVRCHG